MEQRIGRLDQNQIIDIIHEIKSSESVIIHFRPEAEISNIDILLDMEEYRIIGLDKEKITALSMGSISGKWDYAGGRLLSFQAGQTWNPVEFIDRIMPNIDFIQITHD